MRRFRANKTLCPLKLSHKKTQKPRLRIRLLGRGFAYAKVTGIQNERLEEKPVNPPTESWGGTSPAGRFPSSKALCPLKLGHKKTQKPRLRIRLLRRGFAMQ